MRALVLAAVAAMGLAGQAGAATVTLWDEAVDGELPGISTDITVRQVLYAPKITEQTTIVVKFTLDPGDYDRFEVRWGQSANADFSTLVWGGNSLDGWSVRHLIVGAAYYVSPSNAREFSLTLNPNPNPPIVPLPATAPMLLGAVGLFGLRRIRRS